MKKNKKAMALYYPIIIGFVIALCTFYFLYTHKNAPKNTEFVGQVFLDSYKGIQNSFKDMGYIEQSAKYSVYNAMYPFAKRGIYFKDTRCSFESEYIMWENIIQGKESLCYPTGNDIKINFALFLNGEINKYFGIYPSALIPKNNYDFLFEEEEGTTKIDGIATQNVIGSSDWANYSFKPSFEVEISYNIISNFAKYSNKTQEIEDNIQDCLREGSRTADDEEDLLTCSDKLKKEIGDIEDYQIIPIAFPKNYTLLFDIEDPSFNNPYSDEKLTIIYGIRFLDKFPPPPTEVSGVEERTAEGKTITYLTWYKNHASDVESYDIYYTDITDKLGGGEIPEKPPADINKMTKIEIAIGNEIEWQIDYENTALEKGQKYYFYIRAKDDAGNFVKNIDIEPVKITI